MGVRISAIGGLGLVSIRTREIVDLGCCREGGRGGIFCLLRYLVVALEMVVVVALVAEVVIVAAAGAVVVEVVDERGSPRVMDMIYVEF